MTLLTGLGWAVAAVGVLFVVLPVGVFFWSFAAGLGWTSGTRTSNTSFMAALRKQLEAEARRGRPAQPQKED